MKLLQVYHMPILINNGEIGPISSEDVRLMAAISMALIFGWLVLLLLNWITNKCNNVNLSMLRLMIPFNLDSWAITTFFNAITYILLGLWCVAGFTYMFYRIIS